MHRKLTLRLAEALIQKARSIPVRALAGAKVSENDHRRHLEAKHR